MLQPWNAAVFCWLGAMRPYRYRLRKRRVEKRKSLTAAYFFWLWSRQPSACARHGGVGTYLPFTLHHRWWHRSAHLPGAGGHGNHQRRDVKYLLNKYLGSGGVVLAWQRRERKWFCRLYWPKFRMFICFVIKKEKLAWNKEEKKLQASTAQSVEVHSWPQKQRFNKTQG